MLGDLPRLTNIRVYSEASCVDTGRTGFVDHVGKGREVHVYGVLRGISGAKKSLNLDTESQAIPCYPGIVLLNKWHTEFYKIADGKTYR